MALLLLLACLLLAQKRARGRPRPPTDSLSIISKLNEMFRRARERRRDDTAPADGASKSLACRSHVTILPVLLFHIFPGFLSTFEDITA